jgi:hypothetical protein
VTTPSQVLEAETLAEIAAQLKEAGFDVYIQPAQGRLPFDLGGYSPDLVAQRDDGGLIIEVKGTESRSAVDQYVDVARSVRTHPGWRFILVPADRLRQFRLFDLIGLPSVEQLAQRAANAHQLLAAGMHAPAFITAWSGVEGACRLLAEVNGVPAVALSPRALFKQIYSQGLLSLHEAKALEAMEPIRNAVVHGFNEPTVADAAGRVTGLFDEILSRLSSAPKGSHLR